MCHVQYWGLFKKKKKEKKKHLVVVFGILREDIVLEITSEHRLSEKSGLRYVPTRTSTFPRVTNVHLRGHLLLYFALWLPWVLLCCFTVSDCLFAFRNRGMALCEKSGNGHDFYSSWSNISKLEHVGIRGVECSTSFTPRFWTKNWWLWTEPYHAVTSASPIRDELPWVPGRRSKESTVMSEQATVLARQGIYGTLMHPRLESYVLTFQLVFTSFSSLSDNFWQRHCCWFQKRGCVNLG